MLPITRWKLPDTNLEAQSLLTRELEINPILSQIFINRGITTPDDARKFYSFPEATAQPSPYEGYGECCWPVDRGDLGERKIVVYGDYDADGITSTVILVKFLREIHDNITYYIPGRVEEGYGLSKAAIDKFRKDGTNLS